MTGATDRVRDVVQPVLDARGLELYDVEMPSGVVRVVVDRAGGVDLEALGEATRAVSRALDEADPIAHRYTLEVTSPGVERSLRTPEHFKGAVGETVKVKTGREIDGTRRFDGLLVTADDVGITLRSTATSADEDDDGAAEQALTYGDISKARTVFEWGTPSSVPARSSKKRKRERRS